MLARPVSFTACLQLLRHPERFLNAKVNNSMGKGGEGSRLDEPLLMDNPERFCMFPVKYKEIWEMYKKAEASFWTGEFHC